MLNYSRHPRLTGSSNLNKILPVVIFNLSKQQEFILYSIKIKCFQQIFVNVCQTQTRTCPLARYLSLGSSMVRAFHWASKVAGLIPVCGLKIVFMWYELDEH